MPRGVCIYLGNCQCSGTEGSCIATFGVFDLGHLGSCFGLVGSFGEAVGGLRGSWASLILISKIDFVMAAFCAVFGWEFTSRYSQMLMILVLQSMSSKPSDSNVQYQAKLWSIGGLDHVIGSQVHVQQWRSLSIAPLGRNVLTGHDVFNVWSTFLLKISQKYEYLDLNSILFRFAKLFWAWFGGMPRLNMKLTYDAEAIRKQRT